MTSYSISHSKASERARYRDEDTRSSDDVVHSQLRSPTSSDGPSLSSSITSSEGWTKINEDEIDPSDSASRLRHKQHISSRAPSSRHGSYVEQSRPESVRRQSSARVPLVEHERSVSRRPHRSHSRATSRAHSEREEYHRKLPRERRRQPSDESTGSVDSRYEDQGGYAHPELQYPHEQPQWAQGHVGYSPGMSGAHGHYNPFTHPPHDSALVHSRGYDPYYPQSAPFSPPLSAGHAPNPFTPMSSASGYFPEHPSMHPSHSSHRPMSHRPHSYYGSEMSYYGSYAPPPSMRQYGHYPRPDPVHDDKINELNTVISKYQEERAAQAKAARDAEEATKEAAIRKGLKELEERRKKDEMAEITRKAREEAEKAANEKAEKAKEESDKKFAEAKKKADELAEWKKKTEEEIKKNKPDQSPLQFKDAVGRKFTLPWQICKTWKGMEGLIKQAFLHVDLIGHHVMEGHYDLVGPSGDIILPQVWDTVIQPGWEVSMHMWPMPEPAPMPDIENMMKHMKLERGRSTKGKKGGKEDKKKKRSSTIDVIDVPPPGGGMFGAMPPGIPGAMPPGFGMPPPPPPVGQGNPPPPGHGMPIAPMPPSSAAAMMDDILMMEHGRKTSGGSKVKSSSNSGKRRDLPPLAAWMAGARRK